MKAKYYFYLLLSFSICSCIYRAGNRQPDLNQRFDISISPYYVKKYLKGLDSFYMKRSLITSEVVNYYENFIPITDSLNGYKYVIEFHSLDSISYLESHYINLASLYDFKKQQWIKNKADLKNGELEKFKSFFRDSILIATVNRYKGLVPDSLLIIGMAHVVIINELK